MDEARARLAGYLNVATDEVHFGPSTSQNSYVLAQAFRQMLRPGDEIVVTNQDHEANSGAWRRHAERDRKSTRLNSSHQCATRMPTSAFTKTHTTTEKTMNYTQKKK